MDPQNNSIEPEPDSAPKIKLQGFLYKRGDRGPVKAWKKRYFQLRGYKLYNSNSEDAPPNGFIDLSQVQSVSINSEIVKHKKGAKGLQISVPGRDYYLYATSDSEIEYWLKGLKEVLIVARQGILLKGPVEAIVKKMKDPANGVEVKDRKYHNKTYEKCFVGSEAVDWLQKHLGISRSEAESYGQALIDDDWMHHVVRQQPFRDGYFFYSWTTKESKRSRVVILGGGFSGATLARQLEKDPAFDVVMIDRKVASHNETLIIANAFQTFFEETPAALRMLVESEIQASVKLVKEYLLPHSNYLRSTRTIYGEVLEVTPEKLILDKETVFFDYLVIASGSSYRSLIKDQGITDNLRSEHLSKQAYALKESTDVLIVGGGVVGVELAGEIAAKYGDKNITIVHNGSNLLERTNKVTGKTALKWLKDHGVNVIFEEEVEKAESDGSFMLKNSKQVIKAQQVFWCTGIRPNSGFMRKNFADCLDPNGFISVNEFFQVGNHTNIFAAGDVTHWKEEKTAERAIAHSELIASHLRKLNSARVLKKKYKPPAKPVAQVISLGPDNAILVTNGSFLSSGSIPAKMKQFGFDYMMNNLKGKSGKGRDAKLATPRGRSNTQFKLPVAVSNKKVLVLDGNGVVGRTISAALDEYGVDLVTGMSTDSLSGDRDTETVKYFKFDDDKSIQRLFRNIDVVVLCMFVSPKLSTQLQAVLNAMAAVKDRIQHIIFAAPGGYMAEERQKSPIAEWYLQSEALVKNSGFNYTVLRYCKLFNYLLEFTAAFIRSNRAISLPVTNEQKVVFMDIADLVQCLIVVLFNTETYRSRVFSLSGPGFVSGPSLAQAISTSIGEEITFVTIDQENTEEFFATSNFSPEMAKALSIDWTIESEGKLTQDVMLLLDQPPKSASEWADNNAHHFL